MNNKTYVFLTFALLLFSFTFVSGCGKYVAQYSAPVVISRYPVNGASGIGSHETIWLKFSKSADENNMNISQLGSKIKWAGDMMATATFEPSLTPEAVWSEDNTKLTIKNVYFTSIEAGARVHITASREAFQDVNGLYLQENANLWNYTLQ